MDYILNEIRIDEVLVLLESIERRRKSEALLSLAIVHNPFSQDPNALFRELRVEKTETSLDSSIDREGLGKLKQTLGRKSNFIKVK